MHPYHTERMVKKLVEAHVISRENQEAAVRIIGRYWIERVAIVWRLGNVMSRNSKLTYDQGMRVLETLTDKHNPDIGVNWGVIDMVIEEVLSDAA